MRTRWRQLLPWALIVLMLHAWCLAPEPPAPLRSPLPVLQWRLAPPQATGTTGTTAPAETGRHGAGAGAARSVAGKPAAAPTEPAQLPALRWPSSASWHYRLRWQGEEGIAQLEWRLEGDRYSLRLQRQLESRSLPGWHSEGVIASDGLRPERFSVERGSARRQRVEIDVETGAQDRLSWIFQVAAIARAQRAQVGQSLSVLVSGWRGGAQAWALRVEADPESPGLLRLRRLPPSAGSPLEQLLWLDPSLDYQPVRLRQRYDSAERWELHWDPLPPVGAEPPPAS